MLDPSRDNRARENRLLAERFAGEWDGAFAVYWEIRLFAAVLVSDVKILDDRLECRATLVNDFGLGSPNPESWIFGSAWFVLSAARDYLGCLHCPWRAYFRDDWVQDLVRFAKDLPADESLDIRRHLLSERFHRIQMR